MLSSILEKVPSCIAVTVSQELTLFLSSLMFGGRFSICALYIEYRMER